MTAGTAVCNCDQPDTCICTVEVIADKQTYTYQQNGNLPNIALLDEGEGVDVQIKITPKGCVSGLPDCPSGILHEFGETDVQYKLEHSKPRTCNLKYLDPVSTQTELSSKYNIVSIIGLLIKDMTQGFDYTRYRLMIDECKDQKKTPSEFTFDDILVLLGFKSTVNFITVYPKYSFRVGLVIGTETVVEKLDANARRGLMREHNRQLINRDSHKGWTKKTKQYSVNRALTISGFSEYEVGNLKVKADTAELKKEFIEYKNKLTLLNQAESVISTVENLFSTSGDVSYPVADIDISLPTLIVAGGIELDINKAKSTPMIKGKVDISFEPLIGIKLTIDLIQAFASKYQLHYIVGNIREAAAQGKERVENGENGAYLIGKFELSVGGELDVGVTFTYDEESKFDCSLLDKSEARLSIGGLVEIQAGGKALFVSGYLNAGGSFDAVGCCGLRERDAIPNGKGAGLDLIFYHNGIEAKFWAEAGFGNSPSSNQSTTVNSKGQIVKQSKSSKKNSENKVEYTWQIADKLSSDDSTHRVSIF